MQSGQKKKNKRRNSKLLIKEGVDADDHVQQGVPDSMVNSSSLIDFIAVVIFISSVYLIMSPSKIIF